MREIKFRAWDKKNKEFIRPTTYAIGTNERFVIDFSGMFWIIQEDSIRHYDGFIITQYTGLKDKNGKEIYEGDIVEQAVELSGDYLSPRDRKGGRGKVVYHRAEFSIELVDYHQIVPEWIKVIGNIYENPELIKKEEEDEHISSP